MGEKGNVTSEELVAASGGGAHVTAVLNEARDTVRDKVIDKGADAAIAAASDRLTKDDDSAPPVTGSGGPSPRE